MHERQRKKKRADSLTARLSRFVRLHKELSPHFRKAGALNRRGSSELLVTFPSPEKSLGPQAEILPTLSPLRADF